MESKEASRVLCVCRGGNVRSVTLAWVLKYGYGIDALAASYEKNSPETLELLCNWAQRILVPESYIMHKIPLNHQQKTRVLPIGSDQWGLAGHPALLELVHKVLKENPSALHLSRT